MKRGEIHPQQSLLLILIYTNYIFVQQSLSRKSKALVNRAIPGTPGVSKTFGGGKEGAKIP